jgi:hypothetical protein
MTRLEALRDRCQRYPYQKRAQRLTEAEFDSMVAFLEDHESLDHLEFEYAVNRMFLDKEKPQHWGIIMDLLIACNTAAHGRGRSQE